jgi:Protein of unknown function (DUF2975)
MNVTESALIICVLLLVIFRLVLRSPKNNAAKVGPNRLTRIRNASFVFSMCLWLSVVLGIYWFLAFIFGRPFLFEDHARIVISPSHIYSSPSEMPSGIFWLWVVKVGWSFFAVGTMLRLFWLYGKGILFTAKNVNCLRFLGYYFIVDWFINYQMQNYQHDMALSTTPVFVGFFIIFFAWIMDEGRKIREEQELTV